MRKGAFSMAEAFIFVLTIVLYSNLSTLLPKNIMIIFNIITTISLYLIPNPIVTTKILSLMAGFVIYLLLDTVFDILTKKLKP